VSLPLPAHYCVLKCSHTFNILDARGAVSTTERARAFGRMRTLSREIAQLWQQRRAELGHPLGLAQSPSPAPLPDSFVDLDAPATLLFEIGTEELPAGEVSRAPEAVRAALAAKLAATRLGHGQVRVYATPRRIVAIVEGVEPREPHAERTVRGPKAKVAFDVDGNPSKAGIGFARRQGVDVGELRCIDVDGIAYVGVGKVEGGRGAVEVLSGVLGALVAELRAEKNMRWSDPALSFSRPVRWLVAVLGDTHVPVAVSALASATITRVHRTSVPSTVEVGSANGYLQLLAAHGIIVDGARRRAMIVEAVRTLAVEVGGVLDEQRESALLEEITNLVEQPRAVRGSFSERYLELPGEILTTVMRKHQRFVPVHHENGTLLPYFVGVANGECDEAVVRCGYESVLRARYEDAAFFYRADLKVAPETMKTGLANLAFEQRLGSMAERAERIAGLALALADRVVALEPAQRDTLTRAASLAKFDLASRMVVELTSLAGTMAREYARHGGESEAVAEALYEMELPRFAGDALPVTVPGAVLALADRLDPLVGLFAVGTNPTGSSDPFGLRRAAVGVLNILRSQSVFEDVSLSTAMDLAVDQLRGQGIDVPGAALGAAREFLARRYEQLLLDTGAGRHAVSAVLPLADRPARVEQTLTELDRLGGQHDFADLVAALLRVRRILPADTTAYADTSCLREPADTALARAVDGFRRDIEPSASLAEFVGRAAVLVDPINSFFQEVHVLADEPQVRQARLGLLAAIRDEADRVIDWDALGSSTVGS
jgi:glycyl-tRNA synthetase